MGWMGWVHKCLVKTQWHISDEIGEMENGELFIFTLNWHNLIELKELGQIGRDEMNHQLDTKEKGIGLKCNKMHEIYI